MKLEVAELIDAIRSGSRISPYEALLQLALLMESTRNVPSVPSPANQKLYDDVLGETSKRVALKPSEHREIIDQLVAIGTASPLEPSILWAIGKSEPEAGIPALFGILEQREAQLPLESACQLCIALRDLFEMRPPYEKIPIAVKSTLAAFARSTDERLAGSARAILDAMLRG